MLRISWPRLKAESCERDERVYFYQDIYLYLRAKFTGIVIFSQSEELGASNSYS